MEEGRIAVPAGARQGTRDEKKAGPRACFSNDGLNAYFTPCISFWMTGASSSRITPPAISDQKPKV